MIDIAKIKAAAEAATKGPWVAGATPGGWDAVYEVGYKGNSASICKLSLNHSENAVFIATANPATVLEMIALIERQESELKAARESDLAAHRKLAAETLRADQGWQRYEEANKDRNSLRASLAAPAPAAGAIQAMSDAPCLWLEAEESARGKDPRDILGRHSMLYSTQFSRTEPTGNNPRWPMYFATLPQQVAAPAVPEGWKLVPLEPTPQMLLRAGYRASAIGASTTGQEAYAALLAAAPAAPVKGEKP